MRHVVMKLQPMIQNGMVCMVKLQQVLQGPSALLLSCLDIVNFNAFNINPTTPLDGGEGIDRISYGETLK